MLDLITAGAEWVSHNPTLTILVVFVAAFIEAAAVLGILIPGTPIVMAVAGAGAMAGLPSTPVIAVAILGAILGDFFSFWVGQRYDQRLRRLWPLATRPHLMESAERFFARYGTMSVAFCRLVPVLRSTVPLVAGMAGMDRRKFLAANVASAFVWAPAHVVPAQFAGISLERMIAGDWQTAAMFGAALTAACLGIYALHRVASARMRAVPVRRD